MRGDVAGAMQVRRHGGAQELRRRACACRVEPVQHGEHADERVVARRGQTGAASDERRHAVRHAAGVARRQRALEGGHQIAGAPIRCPQRQVVDGADSSVVGELGAHNGRACRAPDAGATDVEYKIADLQVAGPTDHRVADGERRGRGRPRRRAQRGGGVVPVGGVQHERRPAVHREVRGALERRADVAADPVDRREVPARDDGARRHQLTAWTASWRTGPSSQPGIWPEGSAAPPAAAAPRRRPASAPRCWCARVYASIPA